MNGARHALKWEERRALSHYDHRAYPALLWLKRVFANSRSHLFTPTGYGRAKTELDIVEKEVVWASCGDDNGNGN
ncbi:hypothetical protein HPB50_002927 [Hyalomma asiaticum]|uniref:Uncharacterized protein n=1 Tax=Hyalomma asiaticum TaxID=266040 RepID=A0ACB7TBV2_HYAAI|nr:hypothetical protein HPB50_002927 [Hyalomma asiaticum]